ncbi:MAG: metal ABC transporter ATP-binding protein, partial [Tannerellaceae bacterium]
MNNKLIQIDHVSAGYDKRLVLKDIVLSVEENDFLGIIGPNGGGKTTLLKVILGLLKPASGSVRFFENNLPVPHLNIGYLPQLNKIDRRFPISVREVVASGLIDHKPLFRSFTKEQKQQIEHVLGQMEIAELADRPIAQLSGGQLQRVLLGRAIVSRPKLLILDEPNSYVDKRFESKFYHLLEEIN